MDRFAALLGWVEHQLEQPMAGEGSVESKLEPKSALAETESQQKEPEVGEESLLQVLKRPLGQTAEAVTIQAEAPTAQSTAQEQAWQQIAALSTTVNRLVEQLAQEHTELLRLGTLQSSIEPKRRAGRTIAAMTKSKAAAPITDAELPRAVRSTENAEAKINAAIDAVVAYNYAPGRTHEDKWAFGVAQLKRLTRANQKVIERVLEQRKGEIEEHHHYHELGPNHNIRKGRQGLRIEDTVPFEWV